MRENNLETFKEFKKKALHKEDDLFAKLFLNFLTVRIAYFIKKSKLKIVPNDITKIRLFFIGPLMILFLLITPIFESVFFFIIIIILSYLFLVTDWLDGQLARGTNQTSFHGAILDSIADRFSTILFIVLLFSIGLIYKNLFIVYFSIILFSLKTLHLMIITKLFYYGSKGKKDNKEIFGGEDVFGKLGIKKIMPIIGGSGRFIITITIPSLLFILGYHFINKIFVCILAILFILFFLIRIKNLLRSIL
jgi:phosphatidylglycerophosphate synthase